MQKQLLVAHAILATTGVALAQPSTAINFQLASVTVLPATAAPSDIAVADFNHDGSPDIALSERGLNRVAVYLQGNAGFLTPAAATAPAGQSPSTLVAVTLTPNGPIDDIVAVSGPDGSIYPILNSGVGQPLALNPLASSTYRANFRGVNPRITAAYFNKNSSYVSFVLADDQSLRGGLLSALYVGNSTFGYRNPVLSPGGVTTPPCVTVADVDGDAYLDLLTTSPDNNQVSIFYNNICANGCWTEQTNQLLLPSGGTYPVDVQTIDLNLDFRSDIVTANQGSSNFTYSLNLSGRQFSTPVVVPLPAPPRRIQIAELNGDNAPDVIVLCADNNLRLFRNTGMTGLNRFVLDATLPTGLDPTSMAVADLNNDQRLDIAVACAGDNTVHVYHNAQQPLSTRSSKLAGVSIYPNPASDVLQVALPASVHGDVQVKLLDGLGRPVLQQVIQAGQATIPTASIVRGIYILQLVTRQGTHNQRIVLE